MGFITNGAGISRAANMKMNGWNMHNIGSELLQQAYGVNLIPNWTLIMVMWKRVALWWFVA